MTTRRSFLHLSLGALAATSTAVTLPPVAQSQARTFGIKSRDGVGLFVKDTGGSGRAVVMTHAWPLNADIWDYQAMQLSNAGFRVVSYDRRGFGRSDKPAGGYDFDRFADDLADVIEQTGVRDATLVGYSMGGGEVVRYFSRHNGRHVVKAGLVGAAAHYLTEDREQSDRHRRRCIRRDQAGRAGRPQSLSRQPAAGRVPRRQAAGDQCGDTGNGRFDARDGDAGQCRRDDGLRRCFRQNRFPSRTRRGQGADAGAARHCGYSGAVCDRKGDRRRHRPGEADRISWCLAWHRAHRARPGDRATCKPSSQAERRYRLNGIGEF